MHGYLKVNMNNVPVDTEFGMQTARERRRCLQTSKEEATSIVSQGEAVRNDVEVIFVPCPRHDRVSQRERFARTQSLR